MENQSIFRKKSLDKVSSPEQLNEYIKVSRPGVWLVLIAIIILLIAVIVWSVLGRLNTVLNTAAVVNNHEAICYVTVDEAQKLNTEMTVMIDGTEGTIVNIENEPVKVSTDIDAYAIYLGNFNEDDWMIPVIVNVSVPDGIYTAEITVDSVSPISFIIN